MTYPKLRGRIKEFYGTEKNLAEEMGISRQTLSKKLNKKIPITSDDIETFSNLLKIPINQIGLYFFT